MKSLRFFSLVLFLFLASCATNESKMDANAVKKIRKVAIGGITLVQEAAIKNNIKGPKMPGGMSGAGIPDHNTFVRMNDHGLNLYKVMNSTFKKVKNWKAAPRNYVAGNGFYEDNYKSVMKHWKNHRSPRKDFNMFYTTDILPFKYFQNMGQLQRDELMDQLKVDALAGFDIEVEVASKYGTLNGIGNSKPVAEVTMVLYKKGVKDPIWRAKIKPSGGQESMPFLKFQQHNAQKIMDKMSLKTIQYTFSNLLKNKKVE